MARDPEVIDNLKSRGYIPAVQTTIYDFDKSFERNVATYEQRMNAATIHDVFGAPEFGKHVFDSTRELFGAIPVIAVVAGVAGPEAHLDNPANEHLKYSAMQRAGEMRVFEDSQDRQAMIKSINLKGQTIPNEDGTPQTPSWLNPNRPWYQLMDRETIKHSAN